MSPNWPNKDNDLQIAQKIMQAHAIKCSINDLGLLELHLNMLKKQLNFRLSPWVVSLVEHFQAAYGAAQGEYVTRKVITHCLMQGQTLH